MELTLFLSAKNIASHMTRSELKCLDTNGILFRFSNRAVLRYKIFLLVVPFEAIKPYTRISIQASVTCFRHWGLFEGWSKRKILVTYCILLSDLYYVAKQAL
jgi:hypothetical protein